MALSTAGLPTKYRGVPVRGYSPSAPHTYQALIVPAQEERRGGRGDECVCVCVCVCACVHMHLCLQICVHMCELVINLSWSNSNSHC